MPSRAQTVPLKTGGALCLLSALLPLALLLAPARAQAQLPGSGEATPDSLVERLGLPDNHSPAGALRRALIAPGWGQYYNRQYWKIPVVVAGLGSVIYGLVYSWDQYFLYRNAWRYRRAGGDFVPPGQQYDGDFGGETYEEAYATLINQLPPRPNGQPYRIGDELPTGVRNERAKFRKWSEFAIVGTGVFWLFQVADAYVSAHLLGFELGEEVSMNVVPRREGLAARLRVSF